VVGCRAAAWLCLATATFAVAGCAHVAHRYPRATGTVVGAAVVAAVYGGTHALDDNGELPRHFTLGAIAGAVGGYVVGREIANAPPEDPGVWYGEAAAADAADDPPPARDRWIGGGGDAPDDPVLPPDRVPSPAPAAAAQGVASGWTPVHVSRSWELGFALTASRDAADAALRRGGDARDASLTRACGLAAVDALAELERACREDRGARGVAAHDLATAACACTSRSADEIECAIVPEATCAGSGTFVTLGIATSPSATVAEAAATIDARLACDRRDGVIGAVDTVCHCDRAVDPALPEAHDACTCVAQASCDP
jgi:hypothetical protein